MQKRHTPKNLLSLTSEQIGEMLAKGFWGFMSSSKKLYREDMSIDINLLKQSRKQEALKEVIRPSIRKYSLGDSSDPTESKRKGHVPIRSQTGHDHYRHHQK